MMLVFINIFRHTIKCQFTVGTVQYARNNFPLNRFNRSLFVMFLCISLLLWLLYFTCWHVTSFSCANDLIN